MNTYVGSRTSILAFRIALEWSWSSPLVPRRSYSGFQEQSQPARKSSFSRAHVQNAVMKPTVVKAKNAHLFNFPAPAGWSCALMMICKYSGGIILYTMIRISLLPSKTSTYLFKDVPALRSCVSIEKRNIVVKSTIGPNMTQCYRKRIENLDIDWFLRLCGSNVRKDRALGLLPLL